MAANPYIGIDLGTTFSAIAVINEHGVPEVLENAEGERTTPSVVLFDGSDVHVGSYAKDNMAVYPGQAVEFVKRFMGDDLWSFEYGGKSYNASEISSYILKKLKADAEEKLGTAIKDVVITVPAYFGNPQRVPTVEAGRLAGLNVLQVLNEPTAAAYAFGLHKLGKDQRVLVFDLGGGTFDVTVMEIRGDTLEVKATNGDHQLGGKDWDEALIQHMAGKFERAYGINPHDDEADYQVLKEKSLAAKISLSSLPKVNFLYGCRGKTLKEEITRQQFEKLTERLVEQCRMLTEMVLEEAKSDKGKIDTVLLAGGSTRMPMVVEMLKGYFGKEPSKALNPDECVAQGAAMKAALLKKQTWALPGEKKTWALPGEMKDINVTSHSFGLVVLKDEELYNSIIIPKGTPYPCEHEKSDYTTTYDNQETLDLYVLEGEAEDPRDCDLVGSYQIYDIPKKSKGSVRLKVKYRYNENQIVEVTAFDLKSNKEFPMRPIENPDLNALSCSSGSYKNIESLRLAVTPPSCDNVGMVLNHIGLKHTVVSESAFGNLSDYDMLFINCTFQCATDDGIKHIRRFVESGGVLYVSCYSATVIDRAFPGYIKFRHHEGSGGLRIKAKVENHDIAGILGGSVGIFYNTSWTPIKSIKNDVEVHLSGEGEPLLVSFKYGEGTVVFTTFHSNVQTSKEEDFLLQLITLIAVSSACKMPLLTLINSMGINKR